MFNNPRRTLLAVGSGLAVLALCVCIGVFAYMAGRNSMATADQPPTLLPATAEQVERPATETTASIESSTEESLLPEVAVVESDPAPTETPTEAAVVGEETASEPTTTEPSTTLPLQQEPVELNPEDFEIMIQVWDIISQQFDGNLPPSNVVVETAIQQSLELLEDDYTQYIPPAIADQVRQQLEGSFEGIGAFIDLNEEGYLVIIRPIEGQPAALAGLMNDDIVTHVDGISVLGKTQEEIVSEVKGPSGTEVTLTIVRESEPDPFDVVIVRALIELPIVESDMLEGNIAYVRLTSFTSTSAQQLSAEIETLLAQNPQALIFDLRDNPGGFLNQSVTVADLFLPEGIVLYQRNSNGEEEVFRSHDGDIAESVPLIVLVNEGSASASEIVAGAIQDRGRGVVIGDVSFGKGSVQNTLTLPDGSELRVTIARWYTPDNQTIDGQGITPDIIVPLEGTFGTETDSQLQRAIEYLLSEEA